MNCDQCNEVTEEEQELLDEIENSFAVAGYEIEETTVFKAAKKEA